MAFLEDGSEEAWLYQRELEKRWPGIRPEQFISLIWVEKALNLYVKPATSDRIVQNAAGGEAGYTFKLEEVLAVERQHPEFLFPPSDGSGPALGLGCTPPPGYTYSGPVVSVDDLLHRCLGLTPEALEQLIMNGRLQPYNLLRQEAGKNGAPSAVIMNPDSWKVDPGLLARHLYQTRKIVFLERDVEVILQWYPHLASPKDVPANLPPQEVVHTLRAMGLKDRAELADELDKRFQGSARLTHHALGAALADSGESTDADANRQRGRRARERAAKQRKEP